MVLKYIDKRIQALCFIMPDTIACWLSHVTRILPASARVPLGNIKISLPLPPSLFLSLFLSLPDIPTQYQHTLYPSIHLQLYIYIYLILATDPTRARNKPSTFLPSKTKSLSLDVLSSFFFFFPPRPYTLQFYTVVVIDSFSSI